MEEAMSSNFPSARRAHLEAPPSEVRRRIDAAAWASFFIWIGSSMLVNIGWGWFLAGLGAIVLAAQAARRIAGERMDGGWLACGVLLLGAALWDILGLKWPLAPLLMILLGVAVLWKAFLKARPAD
jgi:hypothetical protein